MILQHLHQSPAKPSAAAFSIEQLNASSMQAAVKLCAQAMHDNPIHLQVFGAKPALRQRRLQRLFPALLGHVQRKGRIYGVFVEQELVGVLGMLPPNSCRPSVLELLRMLPRLATASNPLGVWRLAVWLGTWARIDPAEPHWHLGPLAIAPQWQRQGIGTQMIEFALAQCVGASLYLETDKHTNVQLYERYGFSTTGRLTLLGVSSWIMMRPARQ